MIDKVLLKNEVERLDIMLDDKALERFDTFAEMLVDWNTRINLTAITDPFEIVYKHFADSMLALAAVNVPQGASFIDVGTGGGFPGLPLLIARPDLHGVMLDSTLKKLMFVDHVLNRLELNNNGRTLHMRAEEAGIKVQLRNRFDFCFSRAVANLRELSEYCLPLTKVGGTFVALKSAKAQEEIDGAKEAIRILGGEIVEVKQFFLSDMGERNLVVIKKVSPTPPKYPRASAKISKEPLGLPKTK
ncbi:MAG: 16S rRNA (guanine(527)-N(7))-methyltransferase RsmG [Clostridia bacterium]|nr:16S rRNA (guanine(527)-N(7))-methyltransferase RsmG [Clostridia bacterium]MBR6635327.1 16S rRNA (guanine(527)-N(7))-methyltransferase RsmG [Clostridia bacterium]